MVFTCSLQWAGIAAGVWDVYGLTGESTLISNSAKPSMYGNSVCMHLLNVEPL